MASNPEPRFTAASDRALLVSFGESISAEARRQVRRLTGALSTRGIAGVVNIHPAYCSVLIVFDPSRLDHDALETEVRALLDGAGPFEIPPSRTVALPVCYGGEFGPDLEDLAALHGLSAARVIELHASAVYSVDFFGFVPGFAYLSGLPEELTTPRLSAPRHRVAPGSVGIAGGQTGVYPFATPGGWRIIGRTPLAIFQAGRHPMSLIELGDSVRFIPIEPAQFFELETGA